ncbi:hypothetical protein [Micromonospora echinofusca]|uniref:hypothetical protein n=1 Tax=Micromonospora echinofusca TaxID=47858 RepID=UPI0033E49474
MLIVEGGRPLAGTVRVRGYKHALVQVVAATVATRGRLVLENVPAVTEVDVLAELLDGLGGGIHVDGTTAVIDARDVDNPVIPPGPSARIHGSLYLVPAVLGALGEVDFATAGGDQIGPTADGARPVAQIREVLERFGAEFPDPGRLRGSWRRRRPAVIDVRDHSTGADRLLGPRVSGATKTAMLAGLCAPETTVIRNPVRKDAMLALMEHLVALGIGETCPDGSWAVTGDGAGLSGTYTLPPDIAETFTYLAASVHLSAPITVTGVPASFAAAFTAEEAMLARMGVALRWRDGTVSATVDGPLAGTDVVAGHEDVNTDVHPFCTLLLTGTPGGGSITDEVWTHRFGYLDALRELGADCDVRGNTVRVRPGRPHRSGRRLRCDDTRATAVAVLAALGVAGRTEIDGEEHLDRGYSDLPAALRGLGAEVHRAGVPTEAGAHG